MRYSKQYWSFLSSSEPGKEYLVTRYSDESFSCTCPDFRYRHNNRCKHIRKAKKLLAGEAQKNKLPEVKP